MQLRLYRNTGRNILARGFEALTLALTLRLPALFPSLDRRHYMALLLCLMYV